LFGDFAGSRASVSEGDYLPKLKKNLKENILDFWYPKCLDEENGGYITSYDEKGTSLAMTTR